MPVFINCPEARDYFKKHGKLYTIRRKRHEGPTNAIYGSYFKQHKLGDVIVTEVGRRDSHNLEKYASQSGFKTAKNWIDVAHKVYGKSLPDRIYKISRRRR